MSVATGPTMAMKAKAKGWVAVAALLAGVPLAAFGLAGGGALLAAAGLALVLVFWFLAWQWLA
ncbi:MAG TPA: hypothetical protein VNK91_09025, partial [Burkholderiaceae bacterium]|nr:hypothetical protein [Burkholderiaceae bacterium]